MSNNTFRCLLTQTILFAALIYPGCSSAQPQTQPTEKQPIISTAKENIQLKPRPNYISPEIQSLLLIDKAFKEARHPAPKPTRQFFMTPEEQGHSFSIGDTRDGYLVNGHPLPIPGNIVRQLPVQYERGIAYATEDFIKLVTDTAAAMQKKYPGTVMYLGNMSNREGGDIPYSVSHNSGRDGDIGFYYLTEKGKFAHPKNLYKLRKNLTVNTPDGVLTFDLEKNTTLIELLLTHPKINVQFIFLAKYIRSAIHKELINRGASEDLLARFEETVQVQAAHNDHFHIRTYCSNSDICAGCIDKSIIHAWQEDPVPKRERCVKAHISTLSSSKKTPMEKAAALQRIALIGSAQDYSDKILKFVGSENETERLAAAVAARYLNASAAETLANRLKAEPVPAVRKALIAALSNKDSATTRTAFSDVLVDLIKNGDDDSVRDILGYMTHNPHADHLKTLLEAIQLPSETHYRDIVLAFSTTANHAFCTSGTREQCIEKLTSWNEKNAGKTRQRWLISGFQSAGFKVTDLTNKDIPILLDAISGPRPISINAQLVLKGIGKLEQDSLDWSVEDALWHYTRYFKRKSKKYKIDLSDRDEKGNKL
ncbi:MAG: HEAT repeat domain-containing protein [Proteobacteria bacterium]|nr:HEAT repeat domain-containing protein [Pseudomonadota bacterium]